MATKTFPPKMMPKKTHRSKKLFDPRGVRVDHTAMISNIKKSDPVLEPYQISEQACSVLCTVVNEIRANISKSAKTFTQNSNKITVDDAAVHLAFMQNFNNWYQTMDFHPWSEFLPKAQAKRDLGTSSDKAKKVFLGNICNLVHDIMDDARIHAMSEGKVRIQTRHVADALRSDPEFSKMFVGTIPGSLFRPSDKEPLEMLEKRDPKRQYAGKGYIRAAKRASSNALRAELGMSPIHATTPNASMPSQRKAARKKASQKRASQKKSPRRG